MVEGSVGSDGDQATDDSMSLSLPASLFNDADDVRLSFTAYTTAALFPLATDPSRSDRFELGSSVIGATVTRRNVSNLPNNATIRLLMRNEVSFYQCIVCSYVHITSQAHFSALSSE